MAFFESVTSSERDLVLAIVQNDTGKHVGNVGLHRIDWINRSAEFGIVIGEAEARGRGLGSEATSLMVAHGFQKLNLHRIWLGVLADHEEAISLYRDAGFEIEGRLREELLRDGHWHDKLIMGILAREWSAP
jgi:RimJ/RimL family protein N-acetyltransferase